MQLVARTDIQQEDSDTQGSTLDIGPGVSGGSSSDAGFRTVQVWVGLDGQIFERLKTADGKRELSKKLNPRLWSRPSYDQANLMSLILTGSLLSGAGGSVGIGYLTNELSDIFKSTLLSSVIKLDKFEVIPTLDGGARIEVAQRLGRALSLGAKASRGGSSQTTQANFNFRISERWSMEGMARSTLSNQFSENIYKASLRYRVPLRDWQETLGL